MGGRGGGESLELGLEGSEELVECGVDVFVFLFEPLGLSVCECGEALCRGRGLEWESWRERDGPGGLTSMAGQRMDMASSCFLAFLVHV